MTKDYEIDEPNKYWDPFIERDTPSSLGALQDIAE